jgi:hypothetical protein
MRFLFNDGGRRLAGFAGVAGDCVTRSIAIATEQPYLDVYRALADGTATARSMRGCKSRGRTARNGIQTRRQWFKRYMQSIGWTWTPTMLIGSGCTVHLDEAELPSGRLVVAVSKHYTAVINGVIHDTHDPTDRAATLYPLHSAEVPKGATKLANGNGWIYEPRRCVYGYWSKSSAYHREQE